jgi:hypothetical protein
VEPKSYDIASTPHSAASRARLIVAISDICVDMGEASPGTGAGRKFMWRQPSCFLSQLNAALSLSLPQRGSRFFFSLHRIVRESRLFSPAGSSASASDILCRQSACEETRKLRNERQLK